METVTHLLSGALLARAVAPVFLPAQGQPREDAVSLKAATLCGAVAAAFPDIDFIAVAFGHLAYLLNHRGVTHSLVLLPLWALLIAVLCALIARQAKHWRTYFPFAVAGLLIHILGDLITTYGTMILSPLSNARFGWGTTFIFDFWLSAIVIAGLILSLRRKNYAPPALAALVILLGYVGFQAVQKERAIDAGLAYAHRHGLQEASVNALPQPFSPFRWMVVVRSGEAYWYTHINLLHQEKSSTTTPAEGWLARFNANFYSVDQAVWQRAGQFGNGDREAVLARQAFHQPRFAFYRWFATYPTLYRIERNQEGECVWFQDLRFKFPGIDRPTFRYGMCLTGQEWLPARWVGEGMRKTIE